MHSAANNGEHVCKDPSCDTCRQIRQSRFRAWWNKLDRESRLHEIRAGHVRMNLPSAPSKPVRKHKRTREAQERARLNAERREKYGEAFVHMTPNARLGVELRSLAVR